MAVYIHAIETLTPEHRYAQEFVADMMRRWTKDTKARRYIDKIYQESGIDTRHSVVDDFDSNQDGSFFCRDNHGEPLEPSTATRNTLYTKHSKPMFAGVAERLLTGAEGFSRADVTHVITVSCTGFYNPGPDLQIVQSLNLRPETERYHLGFMGCYGAFPAMRMAKQFCEANENAVVLVVCLEFCTLHLQLNTDVDSIIANSLFADGAAGILVSAQKPSNRAIKIESYASAILPEGAADMAWTIGDRGFDMVLSKYVSKIIGLNVRELVSELLAKHHLSLEEMDTWAIHPGGKSILDRVQQALELESEQIQDSRAVLREFGNMSSATVLFVLKRIFERKTNERIGLMAFGPGLSVESAMVTME